GEPGTDAEGWLRPARPGERLAQTYRGAVEEPEERVHLNHRDQRQHDRTHGGGMPVPARAETGRGEGEQDGYADGQRQRIAPLPEPESHDVRLTGGHQQRRGEGEDRGEQRGQQPSPTP